MCVLVTKLRSAARVENQQYYKAAKALLVLNPLLGTTYVITIYSPTPDSSSTYIFECVRAVLLSTQVSKSKCIHFNVLNIFCIEQQSLSVSNWMSQSCITEKDRNIVVVLQAHQTTC